MKDFFKIYFPHNHSKYLISIFIFIGQSSLKSFQFLKLEALRVSIASVSLDKYIIDFIETKFDFINLVKQNSFLFKPLLARLKSGNLPIKGSNFVPRSSLKN